MNDGGTGRITTLCAMGDEFPIGPVPRTISALRRVVRAKMVPLLNQVAPCQLKVFGSMLATDILTFPSTTTPLLFGDQVLPLFTSSLEPLVVVVPAMPVVASPAAALRPAAKNPEMM
jgi:hypothetical protein